MRNVYKAHTQAPTTQRQRTKPGGTQNVSHRPSGVHTTGHEHYQHTPFSIGDHRAPIATARPRYEHKQPQQQSGYSAGPHKEQAGRTVKAGGR